MIRSRRATWLYRVGTILVALIVSLPAEGSAADETAAKCCDQSSTECNSGQSVGDKGSCPGSQACVQFVDKCKKKSPGVLCMCGDKTSSLGLSSTTLTFNKKSRRAVLTVSNTGNVALDLTILESGDTDVFDVRALRRCKKKITSPAERQHFGALSSSSATATVPPQGCVTYRLRFTAKMEGIYSALLDIQSDAITPPTEATITLIGSVGKPTGSTTTSTTSGATTTTTAPVAKTCANGGLGCGAQCGGSCGGICVGGATAGCSLTHCGSEQLVCAKLATPGETCTSSDALCNASSVCVGNATAPCGTAFCWQVCPEGQ